MNSSPQQVFYENAGFEFRLAATKRDQFLTEERGTSLALVDATKQGGTLVDAQIGYDFSESGIEYLEGLRVTLQAQNLTDEDDVQAHGRHPPQRSHRAAPVRFHQRAQ